MAEEMRPDLEKTTTTTTTTTTNVNYWRQTYGSVMVSLTILISSFWTIYISPVLLKLNRNEIDFSVTVAERTWIVSVMDLGNLLSPIVAGKAMDRYGRKRTLVLSAFVFVVCSVLTLSARSAAHLFAARLLAGIGKGFAFTVAPIYVAEISSKTIRGTLSSYFYAFFCVGTVVATAVGPYVSFQTYNLISLALPLFFLLATLPIPESPYYYVMTEQRDKAAAALRWYRDTSTKRKQVLTEIELGEIEQTVAAAVRGNGNGDGDGDGSYAQLLTNKVFRKAMMMVSAIGLTQRLGGVSYMLSYGASDLPDSGNGGRFAAKECFVVFSAVSILASVAPAVFVDRLGRKPILLCSSLATSLAMYVGVVYFAVVNPRASPDPRYFWIPYAVVVVFSFAFTAGLGVLPATYQGEMFPSKIKRYASSALIMLLSAASFLVNMSHETVTRRFGVAGNYFVAATSALCFSVYAYFHVFETKGKTLKEIHEILVASSAAQHPSAARNEKIAPFSRTSAIP